MKEWQANHLIAIAWLAMAAFDKPIDLGSLIYCVTSFGFMLASIIGVFREK